MSRRITGWASVCLLMVATPRGAAAELLYGVTFKNNLAVFEPSAPGQVLATIPITGLKPGEQVWALDFRPLDGQLYGLARVDTGSTYTARLYRIHMLTGAATAITPDPSPLPADTAYGLDIDFDPRGDRLRVVSTSGKNYRINPTTGLMEDGNSGTPALDPDTSLTAGSFVAGIAYSNNFLGTAGTTVYGIDLVTDKLVRIGGSAGTPSPNLGAVTPLGPLGVGVADDVASLDIVVPANRLYAAISNPGGFKELYTLDLAANGTATLVGAFPNVDGTSVRAIAMLNHPVTLYALSRDQHLLRLRSQFPGSIDSDVPITGQPVNEKLVAIEVRPSTGVLYALTAAGRLFTIDPITAKATLAADLLRTCPLGTGMSFDPITDHLRIVDGDTNNLRVDLSTNPVTVVLDTHTTVPGFIASGPVALAHALNPFNGTVTVYALNTSGSRLLRMGGPGGAPSPNTGVMTPISDPWGDNVGDETALDADPSTGTLFMTVNSALGGTALYQIDLAKGLPFVVGQVSGINRPLAGLAVAPSPVVAFEHASVDVAEAGGSVTIKILRGGGLEGAFSIGYATSASGSAQAGSDFTGVSGTLFFADGETSKTITVPILNDATFEPTETATLTLSSPTIGTRIGSPSTTTITILDDESPPPPPPPPGQTPTYVLAEGATGSFFDLDILLANPHGTPVTATLTFLKEDGSTQTETRTLPATSRTTVRVDEIPGLEATAASTVVTSPVPIIVERTMRWADGLGYGAHTEKAVEGAAPKWYFAEGSQGFFSTYLLLANPNPSENTASVEYLREGESPLTRTYTLAANSRRTIDAGADDGLVNRSFGMIVTFAQPGVAERAMYFGADPLWKAGHESAGATAPSATWFLAEGATGPFFETFILLSNPQATAADVTMTFLIADGTPVTTTKNVPAHGRLTVNIEGEDPALANVAVATQVTASQPIVVERAQYWPYTFDQWYEAHNSFGVLSTGRAWGLAEGRVGGPEAYESYILLANPGSTAATVSITFLRTNGTTVTKTFTVPPQSRFNVATGAGGPVPELADEEFGAVITSDQPIAVERAMYSSPGGVTWSAGTNATATPLAVP